jgi:hypothetical protein
VRTTGASARNIRTDRDRHRAVHAARAVGHGAARRIDALRTPPLEPVREFMERKGFILQEKFIFIDGRSGTQIYSEALREERLYNQNDNTPALSSYFELMDEIIPRFLSTLSTQRVRGSRVLIK